MQPNNPEVHREKETEARVDIELNCVSDGIKVVGDYSLQGVSILYGPSWVFCRACSPRQHSCPKLSSMPLDLIPMLIHTPKEVSAAMNIEHYSFATFFCSFPLLVVCPHLDPLRLQISSVSAPLPPLAPSDLVDTLVTQLGDYGISSVVDRFLWYRDPLRPNPSRAWYPL